AATCSPPSRRPSANRRWLSYAGSCCRESPEPGSGSGAPALFAYGLPQLRVTRVDADGREGQRPDVGRVHGDFLQAEPGAEVLRVEHEPLEQATAAFLFGNPQLVNREVAVGVREPELQ